jgi:hypothetical protein
MQAVFGTILVEEVRRLRVGDGTTIGLPGGLVESRIGLHLRHQIGV